MHGIVWLFRLELVKGNKFIGIFFTIFQKKGVSQTDDSALKGRIFKGGGGGGPPAAGGGGFFGGRVGGGGGGGGPHERGRREFSLGV